MKTSIIILHGWGLNGDRYKNLAALLRKKDFDVYCPDLPGFGAEKLSAHIKDLTDYVEFVDAFIEKNKIEKVILIGHSFGGRIAILYSDTYPQKVKMLILTGVPVVRHKKGGKVLEYFSVFARTVSQYLPSNTRELLRKSLYYALGEWDYYKSGEMQNVFKNVIGLDLIKPFSKLTIPVVAVWGKNDTFTPSSDIVILKKLLPEAKFHILENEGHGVIYSNPTLFLNIIQEDINQ